MATYLEEFVKSLPAIQSKQILKLLKDEMDKGTINNIEEYNLKLAELTERLTAKQGTPLTKVHRSRDGQEIDSESVNDMFNNLANDISALFEEITLIDEVTLRHRNLIRRGILKDLKGAVNSLSTKIKTYEAIDRDDLGFSEVQYNNFSVDGALELARSSGLIQTIYIDRSDGLIIPNTHDASVDTIKGTLTLPIDALEYWNIVSAEARHGATSTISSINIDIPGSDLIHNILDNTDETYWSTSTLLPEQAPDGVTLTIVLTIDGIREVSFIEIEPLVYKNMNVNSIKYVDRNGAEQIISSDTTLIDGDTKITFSPVQTDSITLEIQQENYSVVSYSHDVGTNIFSLTEVNGDTIDNSSLIQSELQNIGSADLLELIGSTGVETTTVSGLYSYIIGLDNIRVGSSQYKSRGIHVTSPLNVGACSLLGIRTKEVYTYLDGAQQQPEGSIEYWIYKVNYDEAEDLIDTESFPILPIGQADIKRERMFVNSSSRVARLRFLADEGETISIYTNEDFSNPIGGGEYTVDTVVSGAASFTEITLSVNAYSPSVIYTVSYTPLNNNRYLNINATTSMRDDNIVEFVIQRSSTPVVSSDIYMRTILRSNIFVSDVSPHIDEYKLLAALENKERFANEIV